MDDSDYSDEVLGYLTPRSIPDSDASSTDRMNLQNDRVFELITNALSTYNVVSLRDYADFFTTINGYKILTCILGNPSVSRLQNVYKSYLYLSDVLNCIDYSREVEKGRYPYINLTPEYFLEFACVHLYHNMNYVLHAIEKTPPIIFQMYHGNRNFLYQAFKMPVDTSKQIFLRIVREIIILDVDLETPDENNWNLLDFAIKHYLPEIINIAINRGITKYNDVESVKTLFENYDNIYSIYRNPASTTPNMQETINLLGVHNLCDFDNIDGKKIDYYIEKYPSIKPFIENSKM